MERFYVWCGGYMVDTFRSLIDARVYADMRNRAAGSSHFFVTDSDDYLIPLQ